jgi:NAD(P)-dependent dehydrogenase (short-subunit alcohol dehydrogenase family)
VLDLDGAAVARTVGDLEQRGITVFGAVCDITDSAACNDALAAVRRELGPVDVLVNNAGLTHRSAFVDTEVEVFRRVMEVNYFGAIHCTKSALDDLTVRKGLIITISSIAGIAPLLGRTGYSASKHALHGLFGSLRSELAPDGVGVLLVCPGFTATDFRFKALGADGTVTNHPQSSVGRLATPREVAEAVLRAAGGNRRLLILSATGRITRWMIAFAPGLYERIMARSLHSELER